MEADDEWNEKRAGKKRMQSRGILGGLFLVQQAKTDSVWTF